MTWPVTRTRVAYENPWIVVREDEVVRPDGSPGVYGVVELRRPAVFVVALTDADEVVLVTVDRHTVGSSIEVPAGGTDGQDPLVAARRELAEETGLGAATWRRVGAIAALNGICRAPETIYLATDLHRLDAPELETAGLVRPRRGRGCWRLGPPGRGGHHLRSRSCRWSRCSRMLRRGEITDGETVAALMLALVELGRVG